MSLKHIMLDAETLSTRADACIISIGAVCFDINTGEIDDEGFYSSISVESNINAGRHISEDTLVWWMGQDKAAKDVFTEPKTPLYDALERLVSFIGTGEVVVWSNGADFDIPMTAHAMSSLGITIPWKFWNARCYRTYKNLPGAPKMTKQATVKHNALQDAYVQAVHLCEIYAALFGRSNMKASKV